MDFCVGLLNSYWVVRCRDVMLTGIGHAPSQHAALSGCPADRRTGMPLYRKRADWTRSEHQSPVGMLLHDCRHGTNCANMLLLESVTLQLEHPLLMKPSTE